MLHEILFALLGTAGNIILEKEDKFELQADLKFLNSSEKQIINEICILGFYFKQIQSFLEENYTAFQKLQILEKQVQKQEMIEEQKQQQQLEDEEVVEEQDTVIGSSAYLKAFCFGCEEILDEYREVILSIEKKFLEDRIFTISGLRYRLSKYLEILPDLHNTISKIINNSIKGGQLLDLVFKKSQNGNRNLRDIYQKLCSQVYQVLHQQLSGWLLYGKLQDFYDEFFIYKLNKKTKEQQLQKKNNIFKQDFNKRKEKDNEDLIYDWDQMFSIRIQQLPASFISIKQAEKILFIGKGMKVLRKQLDLYDFNQSFLPEPSILQLVGSLEEYDAYQFQNILEKLRYYIASKLLKLVIIQQNLKDHLLILKKYFLLSDGEFYQVFQDECKTLMKEKPEPKSQNILNNQILPQVFQKLKIDENELINNFSFNIKSNSFEFENFANIQRLNIIGNISHLRNNFLRMNPMKTSKQAGSIWYSFKQNIQSGFTLNFSFRFKKERNQQFGGLYNSPTKSSIQNNFGGFRNSIDLSSAKKHQESNLQSPFQQNFNFSSQQNYQLSASKFYTNAKQFQQQQQKQQQNQNQFCICFQSQKEISTHKKSAPLYLKELSNYFVVKFGVDEIQRNKDQSSIKEQYTSCYVHICKFSQGMQKETVIKEFKFDIEKINFTEENVQNVEIKYKDKQLKIILGGLEKRQNNYELEQQMSYTMYVGDIQEIVKLDMGKCYMGFINNSQNANCSIDLLNMKFYGINPFNKDDPWNGLSLDYDVKWPLNLILSQTVMEQYRTLFRYFFPFRQAKVQLHRVWLHLIKKYKQQSKLSRLEKLQMYLRNQMSIVIEGFWQYFQIDVVQHSWQQLCDKIDKIDDFEELRNILEKHLEGIMQKVFLSYHNVLQTIFQIIGYSQQFENLILNQNIEDVQFEKYDLLNKFEDLQKAFEKDIENLLHQLNQMNKNSNSTFLYQLIVRLDMNKYYQEQMALF